VVPGVSLEDLKKGPGHYPETPLPGQLGNFTSVGGQQRLQIAKIDLGSTSATLSTWSTDFYTDSCADVFDTYTRDLDFSPDSSYFVVTTTDPTVAELTLTSCDPVYTARNRIAVHAFLVASKSDPVGEPTFYDLEANGNEGSAAGQDPAVRPKHRGQPSASDVATVEAGSSEVTASAEAEPAATTPEATAPVANGQVQDAFGDGWFHDSGAWPRSLWGGR
jgi:sortase A